MDTLLSLLFNTATQQDDFPLQEETSDTLSQFSSVPPSSLATPSEVTNSVTKLASNSFAIIDTLPLTRQPDATRQRRAFPAATAGDSRRSASRPPVTRIAVLGQWSAEFFKQCIDLRNDKPVEDDASFVVVTLVIFDNTAYWHCVIRNQDIQTKDLKTFTQFYECLAYGRSAQDAATKRSSQNNPAKISFNFDDDTHAILQMYDPVTRATFLGEKGIIADLCSDESRKQSASSFGLDSPTHTQDLTTKTLTHREASSLVFVQAFKNSLLAQQCTVTILNALVRLKQDAVDLVNDAKRLKMSSASQVTKVATAAMNLLNAKKRRIKELEEEIEQLKNGESTNQQSTEMEDSDDQVTTPVARTKAKAKAKSKTKAGGKAKAKSKAAAKTRGGSVDKSPVSSSVAVRSSDDDLFSGWAEISGDSE